MVNHKVLKALEDVDKLIIEEIQEFNCSPNTKDYLRLARDRVQEAITFILKGA